MPSDLLKEYFNKAFDRTKGRRPEGFGLAPESSQFTSTLDSIEQNDEFLKNFSTPDDIEQYKNYVLSNVFEERLGSSPYKIIGDQRAIFNDEAKPLAINGLDDSETQSFKVIHNRLISDKGYLRQENLAERTFANSMTGGWAKMLGLSPIKELSDFSFHEDGVYFDGNKLNLTPEENQVVGDFNARLMDADREKSFMEKAGESFLSISWDLPLIALTELVTGGGATPIIAGTKATSGFGKVLFSALRQTEVFNILGAPEYADAIKTGQDFDVYKNIFLHNALMGTGASVTGQISRGLSGKLFRNVGLTKEIMKRNPAFLETVGAIPGSFGFGYGSAKISGAEDSDALATGLAFAATHFADPMAYRRMMKLQSTKDVKVLATNYDGKGRPTNFSHDYFVEENGKLFKINNEKFSDGKIVKVGNGIDISSKIRDDLYYYNEIPNHIRVTYSQALEQERVKKYGKELYDRFAKELPNDYVKTNQDKLRYISEFIARTAVVGRLNSLFSKTSLPDDAKLQDKLIQMSNTWALPYSDVKKYVITHLPEYFADPKAFEDALVGNIPAVSKDMVALVKEAADVIVREQTSKETKKRLTQDLQDQFEGGARTVKLGEDESGAIFGSPDPADSKRSVEELLAKRYGTEPAKNMVEAMTPDEIRKADMTGEFPEGIEDLAKTNWRYVADEKTTVPIVIDSNGGTSIGNVELDKAQVDKAKKSGKIKTVRDIKLEAQKKNPPLTVGDELALKSGKYTVTELLDDELAVVKSDDGKEITLTTEGALKARTKSVQKVASNDQTKIKTDKSTKELTLEELKAKIPEKDRELLLLSAEALNKATGEPIDERKLYEGYLDIKSPKPVGPKPSGADQKPMYDANGKLLEKGVVAYNQPTASKLKPTLENKPKSTQVSTVDETTKVDTNILPKIKTSPDQSLEEISNENLAVSNVERVTEDFNDFVTKIKDYNATRNENEPYTFGADNKNVVEGAYKAFMDILNTDLFRPVVEGVRKLFKENAPKRGGARPIANAELFTVWLKSRATELGLGTNGQPDNNAIAHLLNTVDPTGAWTVDKVNKIRSRFEKYVGEGSYDKLVNAFRDIGWKFGKAITAGKPQGTDIQTVIEEESTRGKAGVANEITDSTSEDTGTGKQIGETGIPGFGFDKEVPSNASDITEAQQKLIDDLKAVQSQIAPIQKELYKKAELPIERVTELQSQLAALKKEEAKLSGKVSSLFETIDRNAPRQPISAKERKVFADKMSKQFGVEPEFSDDISQEGIEPTQLHTAVTYTENGKVKMRIGQFASKETLAEEEFHATMLLAAGRDKRVVDLALRNIGKWDGSDAGWGNAHETLFSEFNKYAQGFTGGNRILKYMKETIEKFSNFLHGNGFFSEAAFFRKVAEGRIKLRHNDPISVTGDLRLYEELKQIPDDIQGMVRMTLKSFDSILDKETLTIGNAFWSRLKNKGVKDTEITYLKTFLEDGKRLRGDEFKTAVMEKIFPIQIKEIWETTTPRAGDDARPSQQFSGMTTSDGHNFIDIKKSEEHLAELDRQIETYKRWGKEGANLQPELDAKIESILNKKTGLLIEISGQKATNYRILSFDMLNQIVKQIHNYWGNRKESVGWARVEDEVIDGHKTGYLNVNEIQGQLQYTDMPKKWGELQIGDEAKIGGEKVTFTRVRDSEGYSQAVTKEGQEKLYTKQSYEDYQKIGSQPEFLESMKPIFHELQIKSLIQYAADNGYKGVRFPTKESISKIEGFDRLYDEIKLAESKVKGDLEQRDVRWRTWDESARKVWQDKYNANQQHLKDLQQASEGNVYPVERFYEESIGMYGRKYRGDNWNKMNDVYGNEWFETKITDSDRNVFALYETVNKKLYETANKPESLDARDATTEYTLLDKWASQRNVEYAYLHPEGSRISSFLLDNSSLYVGAKGVISKLFNQESIQPRNYSYKKNSQGNYLHPDNAKVYSVLEEMVRDEATARHRLLKDPEGWNDSKNWFALNDTDATNMMIAHRTYSDAISDGTQKELVRDVKNNESFQKFMDRVATTLKLNDAQKDIMSRYQITAKKANEQARSGASDVFYNFRENIADGLTKSQLKSLFGEDADYEKANNIINNDANKKRMVADFLAERIFPEKNTYYFNSARPNDPRFWSIQMEKPSDNLYHADKQWDELRKGDQVGMDYAVSTDGISAKMFEVKSINKSADKVVENITMVDVEKGNEFTVAKEEFEKRVNKWDRVNAYGRNYKDAIAKRQEWNDKGYVTTTFDKIGDLISKRDYTKMTSQQILALANEGHIPYNDDTIVALLKAIKVGRFEQHGLHKSYTKGLEWSPQEYAEGMERLVNESVSGSVRQNGLISARRLIEQRLIDSKEILSEVGAGRQETTLAQRTAIKEENDYMTKLYNNVAHSDKSFSDGLRGYAAIFYTAMKPSFWVQQLLQGFSTTNPLAMSEASVHLKSSKLGAKYFTDSFSKSFDLGIALRARQKNELDNVKYDKELLDLYDALDAQNLMGSVGIQELTNTSGEARYHYASGVVKGIETLRRLMNFTGGAIEKMTRIQAMHVGNEIAKARGLKGTDLINYVGGFVSDAMAQWGVLGRPVGLNSKVLGTHQQKMVKALDKSFQTFRTFGNSNMGLYERLFRERQWGALGAKMLVGMGLHGITKFPLLATVFAIANLFTDDDSEYEVWKTLDELDDSIGGKFGGIVGRGLPYQFGIDTRNLFDERSTFATDVYNTAMGYSTEQKILNAMLGAPYGVVQDVLDGSAGIYDSLGEMISSDRMMTDDEKRRTKKQMMKMTPLFVRNVLTAMSLANDGVELRGNQVIKSDDISSGDIIYKILGFTTSKISNAYEETINGLPNKLNRLDGKINELKKIRKDIRHSDEYSADAKRNELLKVKELILETQNKKRELMKLPSYREMIKSGLIKR